MVKKKDGTSGMCIDYRKLNQKIVKDKFPLPIIEDVLDTLQEAKVYTTLDLRNSYFHVDDEEDCRQFTSFIVRDRQFKFNKVPFGLSTSPGVFQRYVTSTFRDLTRLGIVISYMDDIIVIKDEMEGLQKLKIVFKVVKKYVLEIRCERSLKVLMVYFTKWPEAIPIPDQEASTVAKELVRICVSCYDVPMILHSDQGTNVNPALFTEL
ncbi:Transposon Ty3-I Gag-Pol polyprotein [Araneus ventricosus]|uniref:Transposon Ty3-I Gag-Pol polyprotein n=1 Tax=Araneus ventricosus TaxID=182803 RepID=A0A4Y2FV76_ARAVE|nr:Transposon Ty3-I Gag-Pol polyprotein [Araneus ventricosus]